MDGDVDNLKIIEPDWPGLPEWWSVIQAARYLNHPEPWRLNEEWPLWWRTRIIAASSIEAQAQRQANKPKPQSPGGTPPKSGIRRR